MTTGPNLDLILAGPHGPVGVLVLRRLSNLRELRASILSVAVWVMQQGDRNGVIMCVEPKLSGDTIADEAASAQLALNPSLHGRVHLLPTAETSLPTTVDAPAVRKGIAKLVGADRQRRPSGHADNHVAMLLLHDWLLRSDQRSMKSIAESIGLSYPTVARALVPLEPWLERGPYKQISLKRFPEDVWGRMTATAAMWRETFAFDASPGMARPTMVLMERLAALHRTDLALGGVDGARHYDPHLDLVGSPRLDVVMHAQAGHPDLAWVSRLDPGLTASRPSPNSRVVVHLLRRQDALFCTGSGLPMPVADPAECLLDLVELRLHDQATALIRTLRPDGV